MSYSLIASVVGQNATALFDDISVWSEFVSAGIPERARLGVDTLEPAEWRRIRTANNATGGAAYWDDYEQQLITRGSKGIVILQIPRFLTRIEDALSRVLSLPFLTVEFGTLFPDAWRLDNGYRLWSLAGGHIDHGWGCMFRGSGHDRLVSRRWLDYGPWRVVHLPNDTTFVQFHDLAITDPVEAYEQAKIGHQRMGIDEIGGFIQGIDTSVFSELEGTYYYEETRTLEVVIPPSSEVSQQNMRVACALRLHHKLTNQQDRRVERVAYVFIEKADAERYLHELWLRELECWYVDGNGKHRLDADYHPTPLPPAWVTKLAASSVNDIPSHLIR